MKMGMEMAIGMAMDGDRDGDCSGDWDGVQTAWLVMGLASVDAFVRTVRWGLKYTMSLVMVIGNVGDDVSDGDGDGSDLEYCVSRTEWQT